MFKKKINAGVEKFVFGRLWGEFYDCTARFFKVSMPFAHLRTALLSHAVFISTYRHFFPTAKYRKHILNVRWL